MTDIIYMVFGLTIGAGLGWLIANVQTIVEKRRSAAPKKKPARGQVPGIQRGQKSKRNIIKEDEK